MAKASAPSRNDGQVLKGLLDTLVLDLLGEEDNYGFGILEDLRSRLGADGDVLKEATLYPLLHRLESKNFVESYYEPGRRGTPRKYYRMTDEGRVQLRERVQEWDRVASILSRTILKERETTDVGNFSLAGRCETPTGKPYR
jgi:DNA-binding PadR family transcriptional regulator